MPENRHERRKIRLVELFAKLIGAKVKLIPILPNRFDPSRFAPPPAPLSQEDETALSNMDWSVKEVMVGTVRTPEQLQFHLDKRGYYVPARHLTKEQFPIRYIALHEEDLGEKSGILRWGEVTSVRTLKRGQIPVTMRPGADPKEAYLYFTVKEWMDLPRPITIRDTYRGKPQFTNFFLLLHCTESYQLFAITSPEDFRLIAALTQSPTDTAAACLYHLENRAVFQADGYFIITDSKGKILEKVSVQSFANRPRQSFWQLKKALK